MHTVTRLSLDWPRASLGLTLAATIVLGAGALRLTADAGFRAYVGSDHPAVRQLDHFLERFGGGLPAAAVFACEGSAPCRSVFEPAAARMAADVVRVLAPVAGVVRVESPATSALLVPSADGFEVRRLVEAAAANRESEPEPVSTPDWRRLQARALVDPTWVGRLVSADGRVGAIVIELASSDSEVNLRVMDALETALAPHRAAGFAFHLVGDPVEFVVAGRDLQRDTFRLVPAIALLIGAVVYALFRSLRLVAVSLGTVGLAVVWSFGAMGWLGWPQTAVTQALAPFLLVVGVCNAVHLLSRTTADADPQADRGLATCHRLRAAAADVGPACAVATATTAAGFLSFATSGAVSFARFGVIAAVGVLAALLLCFSVLPVLARGALLRSSPGFAVAVERVLRALVRVAERRTAALLLTAAVLAAVCSVGVTRLRVEVDVEHLFGEQSDVTRWIHFVESRLRESASLEVELRLPPGASPHDPGVLAQLERARRALSGIEGFGRAESVAGPLAWLSRLLHDDDPRFQKTGASRAANAELFFLAELHDDSLLERWVGRDGEALRISVPVGAAPHSRAALLLREARAALASELPVGWDFALTGSLAAAHHMVEEVQRTQLRSFATAGVVVFLLIAWFLRSLRWGVLATLPNLLPVVACLGAMGLWGIYLDMGTAMVAAVVLGIAVDDTVHVLSQYRRRIDAGAVPEAAVRQAVLHVGCAVVTTSFALAAGFFVLTLSSWASVASFGFLSGIGILGALVADLLVLPAMLIAVARASTAHRSPLGARA